MRWFLLRRIAWGFVLFVLVTCATFVAVHLAPGDPVGLLAGERSTAEFQEQLRVRLGLDRPLYEQLFLYLGSVLRGDLGYSFTYKQPVADLILSRLPPTLLLMSTSLVISAIVGVFIGVWTAVRSRSPFWNGVSIAAVAGYSVPVFWLGQLLILVFVVNLGWFPFVGMTTEFGTSGPELWLDIAAHMILPVTTLVVFQLALISRITRASMGEVLDQDYMISARGKGLSLRDTVYRHGLRNALLPVITVLGLQLGELVTGFVLIESVFGWPGLGRLTYDAIAAQDYPIINGMFIFMSLFVIVANLLTDIVYMYVDPRIRYA